MQSSSVPNSMWEPCNGPSTMDSCLIASRRRGSEWVVEDLESRNGTFVNGVRIDQPEVVGADSEIKLGRTTVRLNA